MNRHLLPALQQLRGNRGGGSGGGGGDLWEVSEEGDVFGGIDGGAGGG